MATGRQGDSRIVFLVIRGALWGLAAGAAVAVLLELLGLLTGGAAYFGVLAVTAGPPSLAAGALGGVLVALLTWAAIRGLGTDALQRSRAVLVAGALGFVLSVGGVAGGTAVVLGWLAEDGVAAGGTSWLILSGLIVLLIGVPIAGLAAFAAGKVFDAMALRFPR